MFIKHTNMHVAASGGQRAGRDHLPFLHTLVGRLKTYFGTIDEDSIRNNFVLIYELLDEVLDYGFPELHDGRAEDASRSRATSPRRTRARRRRR